MSEKTIEAAFMLARDFLPGAQIRVGKGFECLREGSVHAVTTDANGDPCIRCQFDNQERAGWHYPTRLPNKAPDDPIPELYLERAALPSCRQWQEEIAPANLHPHESAMCDRAYQRAALTDRHAADALRPAMRAILESAMAGHLALSLPAVQGEWRDISTAPKDMGEVDIYVPGIGRITDCFWRDGWWAQRTSHGVREFHLRPTHWMPLPTPPVAEPKALVAEGRTK